MDSMLRMPARGAATLRSEADYERALEEMESLFLSESGSPEALRFDQLAQMIEAYEARQSLFHPSTVT